MPRTKDDQHNLGTEPGYYLSSQRRVGNQATLAATRSPDRTTSNNSLGVIRRLVTSATANGAAAPIANAQLIAHINANSSQVIRDVAQHAHVALDVTWDGLLGAAIDTRITINWNDGAPHGPIDMFNAASIPTVQAIDFQNLANYGIDIAINMPNPPPAGTTHRGNLLHELEAHIRLVKTVTDIIDTTWNSVGTARPLDANAPQKIGTTMTARNEDAEHKMLARGGGGSQDAMTRTVLSAPRGQAVAILTDIANDRAHHLQLADANQHYSRIEFNLILTEIAKWADITGQQIYPLLVAAESTAVAAVVTGIRAQTV